MMKKFSPIIWTLLVLKMMSYFGSNEGFHLVGVPSFNVEMSTITAERENECSTKYCQQAAEGLMKNMDMRVNPCDNFYRFACGGFVRSAFIPGYKSNVGGFGIHEDKVLTQLRISIEEESPKDELRAFKLAKNLYKICMNKSAIENQGLEPLIGIVNGVGGWPVVMAEKWKETEFDWIKTTYELYNMGYQTHLLFASNVNENLTATPQRNIYLDQIVPMIDNLDSHEAYLTYMTDIAVLLGANDNFHTRQELLETVNFEKKLALITIPQEERRNYSLLYNPMTVRELKNRYSFIEWKNYLKTIHSLTTDVDENDAVNVVVPDFFSRLNELLKMTSKRILANYMLWKTIYPSVSYLNDQIRGKFLAFSTIVTGQTEMLERWKECINVVQETLPISASALYVLKHFKKENKAIAKEMVENIRHQFSNILSKLDWMGNKSKLAANKKVEFMTSQIAYPDQLLNNTKINEYFKDLKISDENFLQSFLGLKLFERKSNRNRDWMSFVSSTKVDAYYIRSSNRIYLPAGILQGFFLSKDRPNYMNYAAIGSSIGHEMAHGFDYEGRQYNEEGRVGSWWDTQTNNNFVEKIKCIINQYENYTDNDLGLRLNGTQTLGENIADNGGIKAAYFAYQNWIKENGSEKTLPGLPYTVNQLFWISAANKWCIKYRPEYEKLFILKAAHSIPEFRILGSFSNMPEFSQDFNCSVGTNMNKNDRCSFW